MKISIIKALPIAVVSALAFTSLQAQNVSKFEQGPGPGFLGGGHHGKHHGKHGDKMKGKMDPGRHLLRFADRLDLTDEQEVEILKLSQQFRNDLEANFEATKEAKENIKSMHENKAFDEATFREAMASIQPAMVEAMVIRAKYKEALNSILTEEQLKKVETMKAKMKTHGERLKEGMKKRGEKSKNRHESHGEKHSGA